MQYPSHLRGFEMPLLATRERRGNGVKVTPDERYFVVRSQLWRMANPMGEAGRSGRWTGRPTSIGIRRKKTGSIRSE